MGTTCDGCHSGETDNDPKNDIPAPPIPHQTHSGCHFTALGYHKKTRRARRRDGFEVDRRALQRPYLHAFGLTGLRQMQLQYAALQLGADLFRVDV